mmetsp:Transcript_74875/g.216452  ORF Transcript_74875/g.216452 Transcript_74875/m.216452 type:complete len:273 (+) Transcript_74875:232-1050(+)
MSRYVHKQTRASAAPVKNRSALEEPFRDRPQATRRGAQHMLVRGSPTTCRVTSDSFLTLIPQPSEATLVSPRRPRGRGRRPRAWTSHGPSGRAGRRSARPRGTRARRRLRRVPAADGSRSNTAPRMHGRRHDSPSPCGCRGWKAPTAAAPRRRPAALRRWWRRKAQGAAPARPGPPRFPAASSKRLRAAAAAGARKGPCGHRSPGAVPAPHPRGTRGALGNSPAAQRWRTCRAQAPTQPHPPALPIAPSARRRARAGTSGRRRCCSRASTTG